MESSLQPKFTIVMTLFGTHHFLPRAIACLMEQTCDNWELILVSDGPAPRARHSPCRVLFPLQKRHPINRIEFHELPRAENCWGNVARSFGLSRASGDYICWINHDNLITPDFLRTHLRNIRRQPGCLSVVDIQLWREDRYIGRFPRAYRCGKIDLLCFALPTQTARELDAFGPAMERLYAADGRVFDAAARLLPIQHQRRIVGTHF